MASDRVELSREMLHAALGDSWPQADVSAAAELLSGGEGQFPSGIRSLPSDLVSAVQRERMLAGMLRATAELGYREVSVQDVLDRAAFTGANSRLDDQLDHQASFLDSMVRA